jgi:hypothetical protein
LDVLGSIKIDPINAEAPATRFKENKEASSINLS